MTRRQWIVVALGAMFVGVVAALALKMRPTGKSQTERILTRHDSVAEAAHPVPTLYCDFYNFMHNATVVSFYFSVDRPETATPNVSELFIIDSGGVKTEFGGDGSPPPHWSYHVEDGAPTLTSPDAATEIVLYGFKPHVGGVFWVEAGVRSNDYRNLEGNCRQANFDDAAKAKAPEPRKPGI